MGQSLTVNKRNNFLDIYKLILAIGVIFVHFPFYGAVGKVLASIGQMGVIVFFLLSGYSACGGNSDNSQKILKRFKRNLILTVISVSIYILFTAVEKLV